MLAIGQPNLRYIGSFRVQFLCLKVLSSSADPQLHDSEFQTEGMLTYNVQYINLMWQSYIEVKQSNVVFQQFSRMNAMLKLQGWPQIETGSLVKG